MPRGCGLPPHRPSSPTKVPQPLGAIGHLGLPVTRGCCLLAQSLGCPRASTETSIISGSPQCPPLVPRGHSHPKAASLLGPYGSGQWVWGQPPAQHLSREVTAAEKPSCSLGDTTRVLPACIPHPWLHNELSLPHITPLDKQFAHQCVSNVFLHVPYNDQHATPAALPCCSHFSQHQQPLHTRGRWPEQNTNLLQRNPAQQSLYPKHQRKEFSEGPTLLVHSLEDSAPKKQPPYLQEG